MRNTVLPVTDAIAIANVPFYTSAAKNSLPCMGQQCPTAGFNSYKAFLSNIDSGYILYNKPIIMSPMAHTKALSNRFAYLSFITDGQIDGRKYSRTGFAWQSRPWILVASQRFAHSHRSPSRSIYIFWYWPTSFTKRAGSAGNSRFSA
jgi:hypothetical protein